MNRKKISLLLLLFIVGMCTEAHPFDVDRVKSGMSQNTVLALAGLSNNIAAQFEKIAVFINQSRFIFTLSHVARLL